MAKGVYLIHFEQPIGKQRSDEMREHYNNGPRKQEYTAHAQHYLGYSDDIDHRITEHTTGGSKASAIMRAVKSLNIDWEVARVWEGTDISLEGKLKRQKNSPRLCPICKALRERKVN